MKKKFIKYAVMVSVVSCCLLLADKSTSSANIDKNIEENNTYSANETNVGMPSVYKKADDSDKVVNGYPEAEYKYEIDDNGDITLYPFLRYTYVNEDGDIAWSEPVKDIGRIKEYFNNEEITGMLSEGGRRKIDTSMLEE